MRKKYKKCNLSFVLLFEKSASDFLTFVKMSDNNCNITLNSGEF